jgi:hypothetical protein
MESEWKQSFLRLGDGETRELAGLRSPRWEGRESFAVDAREDSGHRGAKEACQRGGGKPVKVDRGLALPRSEF